MSKEIFINNIVQFKNTFNTRTVGDIKNIHNQLVKREILYRSDNLARLNSLEVNSFSLLGINKIIDFRSKKEIEKEPNILPEGCEYIKLSIPSDGKVSKEIKKVLSGELKIDMKDYLIDANKDFVLNQQHIFAEFIREIIKSNGEPVLYHCTAGKDRTGFATVLILSILEVDRETIIEEYMFSNDCIEKTINQQLAKVCRIMDIEHKDSFKLLPLMYVNLDYINTAFNTIDYVYGGMDNYIRSGLGITNKEIQKLKNILLHKN